jgi:hypothetical protein
MPLKTGKTDADVSANIKTEIAAGKPKKQAIVIAMEKAGKSRKNAPGQISVYRHRGNE